MSTQNHINLLGQYLYSIVQLILINPISSYISTVSPISHRGALSADYLTIYILQLNIQSSIALSIQYHSNICIEQSNIHSFAKYSIGQSSTASWQCGGTGMDTTVPTNTIQVPNTTGTVTDSGRFCEYWLYWAKSWYIYRTGKL